jgi:hypothetical protein
MEAGLQLWFRDKDSRMQVAIPPSVGNFHGSKWVCTEADWYLSEFAGVVEELVALHEQWFIAIVQGDESADRFDALIFEANRKKQNAKYAYLRHVERHECGFHHDTDSRRHGLCSRQGDQALFQQGADPMKGRAD